MCPCLTPARNLRRKPFCLVFLRYFSGVFQPIFLRDLIKGYKFFQLLDTSKFFFPHFISTVYFLWFPLSEAILSKERFLHWPRYKMRLFWGATRIAQWHFIEQGSGCGKTLLHSKDPHQHWRKMAQVCRNSCGASFRIPVQPRAVPAAGLSLGVPVTGTTHFTEDQGLKTRTAILRMEQNAQQSRARRWMFKINKSFFFPSRSGFAICFSLLLCVCICVCMQLFPLLAK